MKLTREQRYGIYTLLKTGHNQAEIAKASNASVIGACIMIYELSLNNT